MLKKSKNNLILKTTLLWIPITLKTILLLSYKTMIVMVSLMKTTLMTQSQPKRNKRKKPLSMVKMLIPLISKTKRRKRTSQRSTEIDKPTMLESST